jgi:hypothetical protein
MKTLAQLDRTIVLCRDHVLDVMTNEEICSNFLSLRALCVSDLRNLSSQSGQTALLTLVSMLNRMGMQVGLAIPDVPIINPQLPMSGTSFSEGLIASSETFISGATVRDGYDFTPDLIFALGDTEFTKKSAPCWRLSGSEWCGALAVDGAQESPSWTADWSIGAMVSAALASSEAFKFVIRRLPFRNQADQVFFEMSPVCHWDFGRIPIPKEEIDLGRVDLISAGAICQAVLYALLSLPRVRLSGRIFDDDVTDASNLNRNMLSTVADVGSAKVNVAAQCCGTKLQLDPIKERFLDNGSHGSLADRVLVGVDHIPSRWDVQRSAPCWLAISGTSHFSVSSSAHEPKTPCSGCLHPVDDDAGPGPIPTVSFVSFWAGLAMAVRLVRETIGFPYPASQQHLWLTPLRMDLRNAAMWHPVAAIRNCPTRCRASQAA